MEFPSYLSLAPHPGYNLSYLASLGIRGEAALFDGDLLQAENETRHRWTWGGVNESIKGNQERSQLIYILRQKN